MKTFPGLLQILPHAGVFSCVILFTGCATNNPSIALADYNGLVATSHPENPGINRNQQVANRAKVLFASGKFQTRESARTQAEQDVPDVDAQETAWAQSYSKEQKRRAAQSAFESDLRRVVFDERR